MNERLEALIRRMEEEGEGEEEDGLFLLLELPSSNSIKESRGVKKDLPSLSSSSFPV